MLKSKIAILVLLALQISLKVQAQVSLEELNVSDVKASSGMKLAKKAADGRKGTHWMGNEFVEMNHTDWLIFDFKKTSVVKEIEIMWETAANEFKIQYQDQSGGWVTAVKGTNKNKYGLNEPFTNKYQVDFNTSRIRLLMEQRVMQTIYSGGDIEDDEPLPYAIREVTFSGCDDCKKQ